MGVNASCIRGLIDLSHPRHADAGCEGAEGRYAVIVAWRTIHLPKHQIVYISAILEVEHRLSLLWLIIQNLRQ
jgi:hypothetical protein